MLTILWTVSLAVVLLFWLHGKGRLPFLDRFNQHLFVPVQGAQPSGYGPYSYFVSMGTKRLSQTKFFTSPSVLLEDGLVLGSGNAPHADIGALGDGRFSFWQDGRLYFSTSDNSNPRTNGRTYVLVLPLSLSPAEMIVACAWIGLLTLGLLIFILDFVLPPLADTRRPSLIKGFWLILFRGELVLWGLYFCGKAFFTPVIFPLVVNWTGKSPRFLSVGISLIMIGTVILAIPKMSYFLRNNKISVYLIPMHLWCLIVLIGMELILRVTVYSRPLLYRGSNLGSVPVDGSLYLWGREGYAITQYDEPAGEIHTPFYGGDSIIILGDSITEGLQVPDNQKYASVTETVLRQDGYKVDVHNLGRSGEAMADYVSWMGVYLSLYHPKAIVVELQQNDFVESFQPVRTNYFLAENSIIIDIVHRNEITDDYRASNFLDLGSPFFMFSEFGEQRLAQMKSQVLPLAFPVFGAQSQAQLTPQAASSSASSIPDEFDTVLARQEMDLLIQTCRGVPLIVVTFPVEAPTIDGNQITMSDPEQESLKRFLSNYPQVTLVDPLPAFQSLVLSGYLPRGFINSTIPGWGHLNRRGNEALGNLLAKTIEEVLK